MFICVGPSQKRLPMYMTSIYTPDEMFDKAVPHLSPSKCNVIHRNGQVKPVTLVSGIALEFGPGLFTRIADAAELKLASRMSVGYHDSLRTESEQFSIEAAQHDLEDTALLEEACIAHNAHLDLECCEDRDDSY
jgi:hypothetical protein